MKRARKLVAAFALFAAAAIGCNGLLGIDDGAYAPNTDSGISPTSETGTGPDGEPLTDGPSTIDAPFDSNLPKNDAGNDLLAVGQDRVLSLVQDADNLYWISGGAIMTVPKSGAAGPRTITTVPNASLIAVDPGAASPAENVYVVAKNEIFSYPKLGGTGMPSLVTTLAVNRTAVALGSDGKSALLMIDFKELSPEEYVAKRVSRSGGSATQIIASTDVQLLGVSSDWAAFIDEPGTRRIYEVAPPATGSAGAGFGNVGPGFPVGTDIRNMPVDATKMYWLDYVNGSGTVLRSRVRNTAALPDDIATFADPAKPLFVAVDGANAYVLTRAEISGVVKGDVIRVVKGSPDVTIIKDLQNPTGLVAAGGYVFVAEDVVGKGTIQKIKPK